MPEPLKGEHSKATDQAAPAAPRDPITVVDGINIYSRDQVFEPNDERASEFMIREIVKLRLALDGSAHQPGISAVVEELQEANATALEGRSDPCKASAAFPLHIPEWQVRRWCRESSEAELAGVRPHFRCWKEGKCWFVDKIEVDAFLIKNGIRPVDFEKSAHRHRLR